MRPRLAALTVITVALATTATGAVAAQPATDEAGPAEVRWQERSSSDSPIPVRFIELAYDAGAQQTILFGGQNSGDDNDETWAWDGRTWSQLDPATSPPGRFNYAMAYDPVRDQVVLFGGEGRSEADTWVFADGDWTQRHPSKSPPATAGPEMAFDPRSQRMIMFGGYSDRDYVDTTWAWDGVTWTKLRPSRAPSPRDGAEMAYDPTRDALVLFGGYEPGTVNDTWRWTGSNWRREDLRRSPSSRTHHAMSTLADGIAVYGGTRYRRGDWAYLGSTWVLDRHTWRRERPQPTPGSRSLGAMEWDAVRGEAVLFGGYLGELPSETWILTP